MTYKPKRVLIDTDVGSDVDDALAILFALKSPQILVEGITTVYGVSDIRAKIAKKLTGYAERSDIPVIAGESNPLRSYRKQLWHTGREGLGVLTETDFGKSLDEMDIKRGADDFLIEKIMSNPGKYTIITLGALTNIALALRKEPRIAQHIKEMYIMGGAIAWPHKFTLPEYTNTSDPEHNFFCDPLAAQEVFLAPIRKEVFPLDITTQVPVSREDFEKLNGIGTLQDAVKALVDEWFEYRDEIFQRHVGFTCMHDPLTVASLVYPSLTRSMEMGLSVDSIGRTRTDNTAQKVNLHYTVNKELFEAIFFNTVTRR
jgi:purine nucleosidase